ncbi:MAG: molybdate ABC transporter substrate-binding protein [Hyphomicrobiaceae bacterium]
MDQMMDIKVLSGGAANGLVSALEPSFRKETGFGVSGDFGAVGGMRDRILGGEAVDLILLTKAIVADLDAKGIVVGDTISNVGTVATSVAVRDGDSAPDVSDSARLKSALLAADAIYFPDPEKATAGIHFAKVLRDLGIHDIVSKNLRTFPNGQTAMAALGQAPEESPIGSTQVTEILNTAGVTLVGRLPPGYELETVYTGAVSARAQHKEQAAALLTMLTDAANQSVRTQKGFGEPR